MFSSPDFADKNETRMNASPCSERRSPGRGFNLGHRMDNLESRLNGPACVVLMRLRVTKIAEDTIAQILLDTAPGAFHRIGAARLVRVEDVAHVFGIEHLGQRRRAHQIEKDNSDQATLRRSGRKSRPAGSTESGARRCDSVACATSQRHTATPRGHRTIRLTIFARIAKCLPVALAIGVAPSRTSDTRMPSVQVTRRIKQRPLLDDNYFGRSCCLTQECSPTACPMPHPMLPSIVNMPWFDVHQNVGNVLVNGGHDEQENVPSRRRLKTAMPGSTPAIS